MKKFLALLCLVTLSCTLLGQARELHEYVEDDPRQNIGIGVGLDYGGIGMRYTFMATPQLGLFGSLGYILVGPGFNVGLNYKFLTDKRVMPVIGAMYGYNAAIKVEGASEFNEIYYGPSISLGVEVRARKNESNFWNFELVVPFRSGKYQDDMDALQNNSSIVISEPLPIAFSIGYHFGIR